MTYYIGNISCDPDYLSHYGIAGMKWGTRNGPPYPLGSEQKSKAEIRKEYRADKKEAFNRGRSATIAERASDIARKKAEKAEKHGSNAKKEMTKELQDRLEAEAKRQKELLIKHHDEMLKKYGNERVKDIRYNVKTGDLAEDTLGWGPVIASALATVGSFGISYLLKFPFFVATTPKGPKQLGKDMYERYRDMYIQEMKKSRSQTMGNFGML